MIAGSITESTGGYTEMESGEFGTKENSWKGIFDESD